VSRMLRKPWGSRGPFNLLLKYTFLNSVIVADSHIPADLDLGLEVHCNEPTPGESIVNKLLESFEFAAHKLRFAWSRLPGVISNSLGDRPSGLGSTGSVGVGC